MLVPSVERNKKQLDIEWSYDLYTQVKKELICQGHNDINSHPFAVFRKDATIGNINFLSGDVFKHWYRKRNTE